MQFSGQLLPGYNALNDKFQVIKPGRNVLSVEFKGKTEVASLLANGQIEFEGVCTSAVVCLKEIEECKPRHILNMKCCRRNVGRRRYVCSSRQKCACFWPEYSQLLV